MLGAYNILTVTLYFLGDLVSARQYARQSVQLWRSGNVQVHAEEYNLPVVECLIYWAVCEWHLGEIASSQATMAEAISLAKKLNDTNALALALAGAAGLAVQERSPAKADRFASELIELSTRHNFVYFLPLGA